jgi:hypothetical protein
LGVFANISGCFAKSGHIRKPCIIIIYDVVAHSTAILTLRLQVRDEEALPVGDKAAR